MLRKRAGNGWLLYKTDNKMSSTTRDAKTLPQPNQCTSFSELVYFNRKNDYNNAKEEVIDKDNESLQSDSHSEGIASV